LLSTRWRAKQKFILVIEYLVNELFEVEVLRSLDQALQNFLNEAQKYLLKKYLGCTAFRDRYIQ
jgi:hypothetical protein